VLDNTPESQLFLLSFYTTLLQRWMVILVATNDVSSLPVSAVTDLIRHIDRLALTVSQTSPTDSTHLAILEFYQIASSLPAHPSLVRHVSITIPPAEFIYKLNFSHSLITVSGVCLVVSKYKRSLEAVMNGPARRQLTTAESEQVKTFNRFLVDICNCIWRSKALDAPDADTQGCRIAEPVIQSLTAYLAGVDPDTPLASAWNLSNSPTFCLQSLSFLRDLEDTEFAETSGGLRERHGGPVSTRSLAALKRRGGLDLSWQDYRIGVLKRLQQNNLDGVHDLMYNIIANLKALMP
jgi:centromere protein I